MKSEESTAENTSLIIKKDKEGKLRRVWVQQKVKDPEPLVKLQEKVASVNPNLTPDYVPGLHMTLAHFGIPEELYADFTKVKPDISFEEFMNKFYELIQKCDGAIKEETEVEADYLGILGEAAVVRVVKTPEIMQKREVVSLALQQFINKLGIPDAYQFMRQSINLQFEPEEEYKPHITLGHIGDNKTLPQVDVSNLKITLQPSDIGGVEKTPN